MNFWDLALWIAFAGVVAALAMEVWGLRHAERPWTRYAAWTVVGAAGVMLACFVVLCALFLTLDLSYEYVWLYTGTWIPWHYRLAGAWTGREGSLLLWTGAMAATVSVLAMAHQRKPADPSKAWTRVVMLALLGLFALAVARQGTFGPTPDYLLAGRGAGNGINPTLRSPFILIHPPMMFVAYALTIVPASAGIAHLVAGGGQWSRIAGTASKLNWVLYTFAMGLGGIWAYYTLGFGGYWAWDPVEVANLLPWLALTIYLHAAMAHARRGDMADMGPMLAVLPFILTVFSTVSTRSGLWVSVHAFTDPTNAFNPDAAGRLLGILGVDASLVPYFGILLGTLLVALAFWCRRLAMTHEALPRASRVIAGVLGASGVLALLAPSLFLSAVFELAATTGQVGFASLALLTLAVLAGASPMLVGEGETAPKTKWISVRGLTLVSILLLGLSLVIAILWHFAAVNGWSEAFWDARVPWLLTPIAVMLIVLLLHVPHGRIQAMRGASAAMLAAIIALAFGGLAEYAVTLAAAVLAAGLAKMWHVATVGTRLARAGSMLLLAGAWCNIIFWLNPPSLLFGTIATGWPVQVPMGLLSAIGLLGAHLAALGKRTPWAYPLVGILAGFYAAPVFAVAAWLMHRGRPEVAVKLARLRVVAVYGVHFAVGVLLVGYAFSTYYEAKVSGEYDLDQTIEVGGAAVDLAAIETDGNSFVETFRVDVRDGARVAEGLLYYEAQTGAYYPLPGTLRTWHGDVYVQVDAVCYQSAADCETQDWINAYQATFPASNQGAPQSAKLTVHSLPAISLVWGSLALFVLYGIPMALIRDKAIPNAASTPAEPA